MIGGSSVRCRRRRWPDVIDTRSDDEPSNPGTIGGGRGTNDPIRSLRLPHTVLSQGPNGAAKHLDKELGRVETLCAGCGWRRRL